VRCGEALFLYLEAAYGVSEDLADGDEGLLLVMEELVNCRKIGFRGPAAKVSSVPSQAV
jgi:hypothetical protein